MKKQKILTYCINCEKDTIHTYKGDPADMKTNFICGTCNLIAIPEIVSKDIYIRDMGEMFRNLQFFIENIGFSKLDILSISTGMRKKEAKKLRKTFLKKIRKTFKKESSKKLEDF